LEKPLVISRKNTEIEHEYPPGYQSCLRLLKSMCATEDKTGKRIKPLLKRHAAKYHGYGDLFMLPKTYKMKFELYEHEVICADVYAALYSKHSGWCEPVGENLKSLKLEPDRFMKFGRTNIFLEIDRGSEGSSIIKQKLENYIRYETLTQRHFNVVFVLQNYAKDRDILKLKDPAARKEGRLRLQKKRGEQIAGIAEEFRRGNQFLFTVCDWVIKYPDEPILASPLGQPLRFADL